MIGGVDSGDFIALDVETAGGSMPSFPRGFRLLVAGTRCGGLYGMYTAEPASLGQLRDLLADFDGLVVTFNGAQFDLPMIDACMRETLGEPLGALRHYDLLAEVARAAGRRISLDRLCLYTFGEEKALWDHRENARAWREWPQRLTEYNRVDLDLTHELFVRTLRGERLFLGDASVVLPLP